MTTAAPADLDGHLDAELFQGPPRLRPFMPMLRRLPAPVSAAALAAFAIADGTARGRLTRARRWAAARGCSGLSGLRLAVALLANHGRFVAEEALVGVESSADLARGVTVCGAERLVGLSGGALLLGFHLGPPKTWLRLRALGHPVRFAGRLQSVANDPRWDAAIAAGAVIRLPEGDPPSRLEALMRMRQLLQGGALVYVTGDGPFGREAFSIELPGGPIAVRQGWLALRRAARVPTLPVLTWREAGTRVIEIHPPLPEIHPDADRDADQCRAILTPLIEEYVRRHPSQCRWVALPRWPSAAD